MDLSLRSRLRYRGLDLLGYNFLVIKIVKIPSGRQFAD